MRLAPLWIMLAFGCDKPAETRLTASADPPASAPPTVASPNTAPTASVAMPAVSTAPASSQHIALVAPKGTATTVTSAAVVSAPTTPAPPGVGMHFDGNHFTVDVPTPTACAINADCKVSVRLTAKDEFHVNKDYPYKLKLDDAQGAAFMGTDTAGKGVFSKSAGDFTFDGEKVGVMTIKLQGTQAGMVALNGTFKLSVCNASNCQLEQAQVRATVPVQ